jgi:hypothetical protein
MIGRLMTGLSLRLATDSKRSPLQTGLPRQGGDPLTAPQRRKISPFVAAVFDQQIFEKRWLGLAAESDIW